MRMRAVGATAALFGLLAAGCDSKEPHDAAVPKVKPFGSCQIAFRVRSADHADAPSDIHVINPDGTGQRNLTERSSVFEWAPLWSPDGRKIALTAQGTDLSATQIYVVNADGSSRRRLTQPAADRAYSLLDAWSPDGQTIFYIRQQLSGRVTPWAMNPDGSNKRRMEGFDGSAFPSPDGEHIVGIRNSGVESDFSGSPDIYVKRSNGEDGRWLTRTADIDLFGWSPDGEWILYKRMSGATGLYVVRADGSERRRLTRDEEHYDGKWSPDSRLVLYSAQSAPAGLHTVALERTAARRLTRRSNDLSGRWSRTGSRIVFSRAPGEIWLMNRDGTGVRPVAQPSGASVYDSPAWSPACR